MLIHLVSDEFLELELDLRSERLRLAHALGLARMDLTACKVFVTFNAEPLTEEIRSANIQRASDAASGTTDGHSLDLFGKDAI